MYHDKEPHNKSNAINPVKNALAGCCGIKAATINATMAMLHQGKYKQAATLNNAISKIEMMNFIFKFENLKIRKFEN